jgi:transcriptional regulator with PAS, ATPase and Fis domain
MADFEKRLIKETLQTHTTLREVAMSLGVDQSTISRKIHLYGLAKH